MAWFAIMSKPQREKAAAEALTDLKVQAYLPVMTAWSRERIGSRRKRTLITVPMFRGYLFIEANEVPWQSLRSCRETVRGVVAVSGLPVAIPAAQIEAVRTLALRTFLPLDDEAPSPIIAGQTVEIISGPFTGKLTRVDAITAGRVVALIDTLGGKVRARIPADMVRAA